MADFVSDFWSYYVIVLTILSLLFCLFVLIANSRRPAPTPDNTTGHVWDGDIREANNPLPRRTFRVPVSGPAHRAAARIKPLRGSFDETLTRTN